MKRLATTVVGTAVIAFTIGYLVRGGPERSANERNDDTRISTSQNSQLPTRSTTARQSNRDEEGGTTAAGPDFSATDEVLEEMNRRSRARMKRDRLEDFFVINGIGQQRANNIVQGLVETDVRMQQVQQSMVDQHMAAQAEQIARGDRVGIVLTPEEKAAFEAERASEYREVLGEYYEAYKNYEASYGERRTVATLSSESAEALDYATKETLIQIMHEEQSELEAARARELARNDEPSGSEASRWEAEKQRYYARVAEIRKYNERVLSRAKPYLTDKQFIRLQSLLDNQVRKIELLVELEDIGQ